jgi:hypothetical protein
MVKQDFVSVGVKVGMVCLGNMDFFVDSSWGRKHILEVVRRWKNSVSLYPSHFHISAGAMLDRISFIASTNFKHSFYPHAELDGVPLNPGNLGWSKISLDLESIPEIAQHNLFFGLK